MTKLYILNGPEIGKSFDLVEKAVYIGRSSDNDIQILDKTVSRRHLKIRKEGNKYFLTDLMGQNGTFYNGNYLSPGIELEVKEGVPFEIGMSVICIGKGCMEQISPFLDSVRHTEEVDEQSVTYIEKRKRTYQKKRELIYKLSDILLEEDIKGTLEKVLDHILEFLNRVDRGVVIIIDSEKGETKEIVHRYKTPGDDATPVYCKDVVDRVLKDQKAMMISDAGGEVEDELADTLESLRIGSVMCVPLIGTSKIMGALYVDSLNRPYGFRKEDLSLFNDIGRRAAIAIEYAFFTAKL